jgi:hypothetical protein
MQAASPIASPTFEAQKGYLQKYCNDLTVHKMRQRNSFLESQANAADKMMFSIDSFT